jgi:hypothetical protein
MDSCMMRSCNISTRKVFMEPRPSDLTPVLGSMDVFIKRMRGDVAGLHLPVLICFIETAQKVENILIPLLTMVTDGLVEAHPTEILKNISTGERVIS